jgi:glycosyltransferase involved in cell wall biosynthesis
VLGYALARRRDPRLPPLVFNPHGLEEFGSTDPSRARAKVLAYWPLRQAVAACARAADTVVATDHALVPVVLRHLPIQPQRVSVVPNAVDLVVCDGLAQPADGVALRAAYGLDVADPVLLSVGRIEENKGFQVLAEALAALAARHRFRWVLAGEGPYRQRLQHRIEAAGLASRMIWAGRATDRELHAWYEAADLFVHPTLYEGSSIVTLEAMAHRRPVVASRAGGLPDKVRPGVTGWLVEPGVAGALATVLDEALQARSRWRDFGDAGRQLVESAFAWPAVARSLIALYEDLLGQGRRPGP